MNEFIHWRQSALEYEPEELYKETQANILASCLLLPKNQVMRAWKSIKGIDELAEIFNVTKETVYIRLSNLGLLHDD